MLYDWTLVSEMRAAIDVDDADADALAESTWQFINALLDVHATVDSITRDAYTGRFLDDAQSLWQAVLRMSHTNTDDPARFVADRWMHAVAQAHTIRRMHDEITARNKAGQA